jgi:hypothetical protein
MKSNISSEKKINIKIEEYSSFFKEKQQRRLRKNARLLNYIHAYIKIRKKEIKMNNEQCLSICLILYVQIIVFY